MIYKDHNIFGIYVNHHTRTEPIRVRGSPYAYFLRSIPIRIRGFPIRVRGLSLASLVQSRYLATHNPSTTYNNQNELPPPYPPADLALYLHGQASGASNSWRRGIPWSHARRPWLGLAAPWFVPVLGEQNYTKSKNREKGGVLELGGRRLMIQHNNQQTICVRGRGEMGEEASWAGSV